MHWDGAMAQAGQLDLHAMTAGKGKTAVRLARGRAGRWAAASTRNNSRPVEFLWTVYIVQQVAIDTHLK